jgi:hypothetical protein
MMVKRSNGVTLCAHLIVSRTPVPCTRSGATTADAAAFVVSGVAVRVAAAVALAAALAASMRAVLSNSTEPHQPGLSVAGSTRVGASRNRSYNTIHQQQYTAATQSRIDTQQDSH